MDAKYFAKCKAAELRAELDQAKKKLKPHARVKTVLKKVTANIILNKSDLASLMPDMIELMVIDDYEIRRTCCQYVVHFAELNPADAAAALVFYARFAQDANPMLRALTAKTVSLVAVKEFVSLAFDIVRPLLADKSPHVRTAAAFGVSRMYQYEPEKVVLVGLIDMLNELLYDENETVVASALAALGAITDSADHLTLNIDKNHLLTLTRDILAANEWRKVALLNALMSYVPQTCEDALDVLEAVLPCFSHENLLVVLNAVKVVVYLSNYVRDPEVVLPALPKRLGLALVSVLTKPPEIQFLVLRNVILLLLGKRYLVDVDVALFFWNFDDPIYIKDTKLEIIYLLATEANIAVVFRELEEYATEVDLKMARKAIRAFGNLAIKLEDAASYCVDILADLLADGVPNVVQEAAVVLKNILRKYPGKYDFIIKDIIKYYEVIEEADSKAAITWIVGQYAEKIPNAAEVLAHIVKNFGEETLEVQYAAITAVVKFYVKFPVKGEALVLKVLKWATEESGNPDVRDRGFFYWRLITNEQNAGQDADFQKMTKEVVINVDPLINSDNDNIDPKVLEELELNIGTLASIYLKSVKTVFRLSKRRFLEPSPALQERRQYVPPTNKATRQPIERPPRRTNLQKPLPAVNRNPSFSSYLTGSSLNSNEKVKESFGQKLSRKASTITGRKNSMF